MLYLSLVNKYTVQCLSIYHWFPYVYTDSWVLSFPLNAVFAGKLGLNVKHDIIIINPLGKWYWLIYSYTTESGPVSRHENLLPFSLTFAEGKNQTKSREHHHLKVLWGWWFPAKVLVKVSEIFKIRGARVSYVTSGKAVLSHLMGLPCFTSLSHQLAFFNKLL